MTQSGERLRVARKSSGLTPQQLAHAVGIKVSNYFDLEEHEELYTSLSLAELRKLCNVLKVGARDLFVEETQSNVPREVVTFDSLAENVSDHLKDHDETQERFETKVGWELGAFLSNPEVAWGWNVDCLRDICRELKVDWLSALPT